MVYRSCFTPPHPAQQCLYELELDEEFQFCSVKGSKWDLGGGGDLIRKEKGEVRGDKAGLQFEWKLEWRRGEKQCNSPVVGMLRLFVAYATPTPLAPKFFIKFARVTS